MQSEVKKVAAALCLGALVLTSAPAAAMAATAVEPMNGQENNIVPYMLYIDDWKNDLTISGTTATAVCWVQGTIGQATKAKVVAELQEKNGSSWSTIATWSDTQNSDKASVKESKAVSRGKTYRVKATMTVWEGSLSETQTVYSTEKTA